MTDTLSIPLDRAATHVDVAPGGEIILRGAFHSTTDGSTIDAATTTWPASAPGGASVDAGGLLDLEGGGFHITERRPGEVHAIVTGDDAPACAATGVAPPCLALRLLPQARTRLLTVSEWSSSLKGGITVEVPQTFLPPVAPSVWPYVFGGLGAFVVAAIAVVSMRVRRRRSESPTGRLLALADRVRDKLRGADPVIAAPLTPAIEAALKALQRGRIDPASSEGKRVTEVLKRVELRIDESAERARAHEEQQAADELVQEFEDALAAADEVRRVG